MASHDLKQRKKDESESADATATKDADVCKIRAKRMTMAKRGLKSLAFAVSIPVFFTFMTIYLVHPRTYGPPAMPFWFPSIMAINVGYLASSFLMGLAGWLVWAERGFHAKPVALYMWFMYIGFCLAWYALVLGVGAGRLGLAACVGVCRRVNPIAAALVKPCLAWTVFLAIVNATLISL